MKCWVTEKKFVVHTITGKQSNDYWIQMANSESWMLSCNEVIILLDCYRGFRKENHTGNIDTEIKKLVQCALIEKDIPDSPTSSREWILTKNGRKLVKHLLNEAIWKMVFTPGSVE